MIPLNMIVLRPQCLNFCHLNMALGSEGPSIGVSLLVAYRNHVSMWPNTEVKSIPTLTEFFGHKENTRVHRIIMATRKLLSQFN